MQRRPVLYLDIDDTLLSWSTGRPRAAPGAGEFLLWALERFEVRWLTTWCPGGDMEAELLADLCKMLRVPEEAVREVRGFAWEGGSKLDGVAWLEHRVHGRPWAWLEDDKGFGERERRFLAGHGLLGHHLHCNVSDDPESLERAWLRLGRWFRHGGELPPGPDAEAA